MNGFQTWKANKEYTDQEVLNYDYLNRVSKQTPPVGNEIIYCACGCGDYFLRPLDHKGRNFRYVRGHSPRRRSQKTNAELIAEAVALTKWIQENGSSYGFGQEEA